MTGVSIWEFFLETQGQCYAELRRQGPEIRIRIWQSAFHAATADYVADHVYCRHLSAEEICRKAIAQYSGPGALRGQLDFSAPGWNGLLHAL